MGAAPRLAALKRRLGQAQVAEPFPALMLSQYFAFTASQRGPLARPPQGHPTTRPFGFAALLGLAGAGRTRLCEPQTGCRSVSCQSCATRPRKRDEPECTLNHWSIRPTALAEYSVALPDFMGRTKKTGTHQRGYRFRPSGQKGCSRSPRTIQKAVDQGASATPVVIAATPLLPCSIRASFSRL